MTEVLAALKTIKQLLELFFQVLNWIKANQNEKFFQESAFATKLIMEAKTPEEKKRAVSALASVWSKI